MQAACFLFTLSAEAVATTTTTTSLMTPVVATKCQLKTPTHDEREQCRHMCMGLALRVCVRLCLTSILISISDVVQWAKQQALMVCVFKSRPPSMNVNHTKLEVRVLSFDFMTHV